MTTADSTTDLFELVRRPRKRGRNPKELHRDTFDRLATGGAIGAPSGAPAFGYVRVSSDEQADKGGGIQRQIESCHEAAQRAGLAIPWELLFSDDESGFTLDREGLRSLCDAITAPGRAAHHLVIENIDRLSRNDDWHQGYLLEHLTRAGVTVKAWKEFSSDLERKVQGMVASEGHKKDRERMRRGLDDKARKGFITARKPLYGYKFTYPTNERGVILRREPQPVIVEEEAEIVRQAFDLVCEGKTLYQVKESLPPGPRNTTWTVSYVQRTIHHPGYKGEWPHNRTKRVAFRDTRKTTRPPEEWIIVQIPAIVDAATWQRAQEALEANRRLSKRHAKRDYLFRGLVTCKVCGKRFHGFTGKKNAFYRCTGHTDRQVGCAAPNILCADLDDALWAAIVSLLRDDHLPDYLIDDGQVERAQIAQLDKEMKKLDKGLENLDAVNLLGDVFEPGEYALKRRQMLERRRRLQAERAGLVAKVVSEQEIEFQRSYLRVLGQIAHLGGPAPDWPFAEKQRLIQILVRKVTLDSSTRKFVIEGKFPPVEDVIPRAGEDRFDLRWASEDIAAIEGAQHVAEATRQRLKAALKKYVQAIDAAEAELSAIENSPA